MITNQQRDQLISAAIDARQRAYAVYSKYHVGAALLSVDGEIITACNVENASYGLTICAERVAVFTAVSQGRRDFSALAIATADRGAPCGACRQVLAEFCRELSIFLVNADDAGNFTETSLNFLLPMRFGLDEG